MLCYQVLLSSCYKCCVMLPFQKHGTWPEVCSSHSEAGSLASPPRTTLVRLAHPKSRLLPK
jgi:hypothetical protein